MTRALKMQNQNGSRKAPNLTNHITSQTPVAPSKTEQREERKRIRVTIFRLTESRIIQHFFMCLMI